MKTRPMFVVALAVTLLFAAAAAMADPKPPAVDFTTLEELREASGWDDHTTRNMCTAASLFAAVRATDQWGEHSAQVELLYSTAHFWGRLTTETEVEAYLNAMKAGMTWEAIIKTAQACTDSKLRNPYAKYVDPTE